MKVNIRKIIFLKIYTITRKYIFRHYFKENYLLNTEHQTLRKHLKKDFFRNKKFSLFARL